MTATPASFRSGELVASQFPVDASRLVGRDDVVDDIVGLVAPGRVVTLTGAAGVGTTSVALEVARRLSSDATRFGDGVWLCAMASVNSALAIPVAIADAVGAVPTDEATSYDSVVTGLSGRRAVLIVDNCEQIASPLAGVLQRLVSDCPDLAVVVTSREPLGLAVETVVDIAPLDVSHAAVTLFVRQAAQADVHFQRIGHHEAIGRICASLDGLPLAIELAAAHVGMMTVDDLAAQLDERLAMVRQPTALGRQDSLHGMVSWSYERLDPLERHLFDRLSVFHGGFDERSASMMLDRRDRDRVDVRDLLSKLVDASMVMVVDIDSRSTRRYDMLETLRQFGERQLVRQNDRADARNQHLELVVELVAAANTLATGDDWSAGSARLAREWANIRGAVNWAIDTTRVDDVDRLLRDIHFFCRWTLDAEGALWAQRAIERGPTTGAFAGAPAHLHVGFQHILAGDHAAALDVLRAGLQVRGTPSDRRWCRHGAALQLLRLGRAAEAAEQAAADPEDASPRGVEAVIRAASNVVFELNAKVIATDVAVERIDAIAALADATGNVVAVGHVAHSRALISAALGDVEGYRAGLDAARVIARHNGIASLAGDVLTAQVYAPRATGLRAALEALDAGSERRNVSHEFVVLEAIGISLAEMRRFEPAAMILGNLRRDRRVTAPSRSRREVALDEIGSHRRGAAWLQAGAVLSRAEVVAFARKATVDALGAT